MVRDHIGTDEAETFSSVTKAFGMSNSQPFQAAIRAELDPLAEENAIEERAGKLVVGLLVRARGTPDPQ